MANQQANLKWVFDNPVPKGDKTLYLVTATIKGFDKREASKQGKWSTRMCLVDITGERWVKVWDGNAGQMPGEYLGHQVNFNIKAENYNGKVYLSGFWETPKVATTSPSLPSTATRPPVFDQNGQPMSLETAKDALPSSGQRKSFGGEQLDPDLQDRKDKGIAVLAMSRYLSATPDITTETLIDEAKKVFDWIKASNVAVNEPDEPGADDIPY